MKVLNVALVAALLCATSLVSMCSALSILIIFSRFALYGKLIGYFFWAL